MPKELASKRTVGGEVGDTIRGLGLVVTRVYRDGVYALDPMTEEKLNEIETEIEEITEVRLFSTIEW